MKIVSLIHLVAARIAPTLVMCVAVLSISNAQANTLTWTGGCIESVFPVIVVSPNWSCPQNWSPQVVPANGDTLVFPASAFSLTAVNDLSGLSLDAIEFDRGGYTISGNSITLIAEPNSGIAEINNATGTNIIENDITLSTNCLIGVASGSSLTLRGAIGGPGGITKVEPGELHLAGRYPNTYSGPTYVQGSLVLEKSAVEIPPISLAIGGGSLTIGNGIDGSDADVVRYNSEFPQILPTVPVTIYSSGLLDLNNQSAEIGPITFVGGDITTGTGTLSTESYITVESANRTATINGNVHLVGSGVRPIIITGTITGGNLQINANITDEGGGLIIERLNPPFITQKGLLTLAGSNSFTGPLTINWHYVYASSPYALGATTGPATVTDGGSLFLATTGITNKSLILNDGTLAVSISGNSTWAGPITLQGPAFISAAGAVEFIGSLDVLGPITGVGDLTVSGGGFVSFSGSVPNDYVGTTTVIGAHLFLNKSIPNGAIPHSLLIGNGSGGANYAFVTLNNSYQIHYLAPVTIYDSGVLDMNGQDDFIGSLSGTAGAHLNLETYPVNPTSGLHVNYDGGSSVFAGAISGTGNLFKEGSGTLTLTNNNSYVGTTYVDGGALLINGSQSQSPVNVRNGATLGGFGTVGALAVSGNVAPGDSPGILSSSDVNFTSGGTFTVELTGPVPGTGYDQLNVLGTVNLNNATLVLVPAFTSPVTKGQQFVIINNDLADPVVGTFNGLPEGSTISARGFTFTISYVGGDGNDVVLTLGSFPPLPLHIQPSALGQIILSYPTLAGNAVLESTTNLGPSASWQPVTNVPTAIAGWNYITNDALGPARFYRVLEQ